MFNTNEIGAYFYKTFADGTEKTMKNGKPSKDGVTVMATAWRLLTSFNFYSVKPRCLLG